jgi:ribosomal protein L4
LVYTSLYIKFRKENVIRIQNPVVDPKRKDPTNNLITVIESIEIDEKVRIILELYKNNNLIFSQDNYNNFLIQNLILEGVPVVQSDPKSKNPSTI